MYRWSVPALLLFGVLLLFALFFAFLAVDIGVRVWHWRARFEPLDVFFLLYMEGVRVIVTLAGVVIAVLAARRGTRSAAALAFGVAWATIAYTKLIAYGAFPGAWQEKLALWLRARSVPRELLALIFGHAEWAVWPAVAGILLFAARYPRELTEDDLTLSAARDRRGALRSVALAGVDIGALSRSVTSSLLRRGWLEPRVLWSVAALLAAAHTAALVLLDNALAVHALSVIAGLFAAAILVSLVRAGDTVAAADALAALRWLRRGAIAGLVLFSIAAALTQLLPATPIGPLLLSVAPAAIALCWLIAVLRLPQREPISMVPA